MVKRVNDQLEIKKEHAKAVTATTETKPKAEKV